MFKKLRSVFSKLKKSSKEETEVKLTKEVKKEPAKKVGIMKSLSEKKQSKILNDLEEGLIQSNVAYNVSQEICNSIKESKDLKKDLERVLKELLNKPGKIDLLKLSSEKKPFVMLFVGVNGVGKTTTLAKVANKLKKEKKSVVLAASDTFRAAAIEQLQSHADKLRLRLIKHKYGSDAAAVAYDAIDHAKAKDLDFVLIDSAGRSHANQDLMDELAKLKRISKPDLTILVVDSLTGNDAVEQAKNFDNKIGIDCSILTKTDADERGGAIISVGYESGKPILFLGVGQDYGDIEEFDSGKIVKQIV